MLGHYLNGLPPDAEDRILTTPMQPGKLEGPCLMGVVEGMRAYDYAEFHHRIPYSTIVVRTGFSRARGLLLLWPRPDLPTIWGQFDQLCERFGTARVTAALRTRILTNRAYRLLHATQPQLKETAACPS